MRKKKKVKRLIESVKSLSMRMNINECVMNINERTHQPLAAATVHCVLTSHYTERERNHFIINVKDSNTF